jgi:hypothetical protein
MGQDWHILSVSAKELGRQMDNRPFQYHSFILSLWAEGGALPNAPPVWRFSLEEPHTGQRRGFKDLAELMRFLQVWTAVPPEETPMDE